MTPEDSVFSSHLPMRSKSFLQQVVFNAAKSHHTSLRPRQVLAGAGLGKIVLKWCAVRGFPVSWKGARFISWKRPGLFFVLNRAKHEPIRVGSAQGWLSSYKHVWLGVWIPPKNMNVNWDDDIPNLWKNKSHVPVTTNQILFSLLHAWLVRSCGLSPDTTCQLQPAGCLWLMFRLPMFVGQSRVFKLMKFLENLSWKQDDSRFWSCHFPLGSHMKLQCTVLWSWPTH